MGGRGTASGLASTPTASAAAPAPAPAPVPAAQPAPQPTAQQQSSQTTGRLASDMGIDRMDDATLTAAITRALRSRITSDGRQDTPAQHIADALGFTANKPESVPQEALAQYRGQHYENGTIYRTVRDVGAKTARQIAHDLTSSDDYGLNFGGGRAYGTGLYFAGTGSRGTGNAGARDSYWYGRGNPNSYMMEARIKPTANIATSGYLQTAKAKNWAKAHKTALGRIGIQVSASGAISSRTMDSDDMRTTVAMLMGYDGYRNSDTTTPYYTIWNRGALQVARGNKYSRAGNGQL